MSKKKKSILIKLVSTSSGYFYTISKNPRMKSEYNGKLRLRKFDPYTRQHEWFEEKKIK